VRVLKEVDLIACEDTRHTRTLLDRYDIRTPIHRNHEHNEVERAGEFGGAAPRRGGIALGGPRRDAADIRPRYHCCGRPSRTARRCSRCRALRAALAALAASGLPADAFRFWRIPAALNRDSVQDVGSARRRALDAHSSMRRRSHSGSFESHRERLGPRPVVWRASSPDPRRVFLPARRGDWARNWRPADTVKGEMTVLIGRARGRQPRDTPVEEAVGSADAGRNAAHGRHQAGGAAAGLSKRAVYEMLLRESSGGRGGAGGERAHRARVRLFVRRSLRPRHADVKHPVDAGDLGRAPTRPKVEAGAPCAGAAGPANAVMKIFGYLRPVVVHHVRDAVHVNPARGTSGRHQHAVVSVLEAL